jgi:hypothetical protein
MPARSEQESIGRFGALESSESQKTRKQAQRNNQTIKSTSVIWLRVYRVRLASIFSSNFFDSTAARTGAASLRAIALFR